MSKKALKLVGQRPMLLVIIVMATLTIGLLFSGWLTPTPGKAQQGMAADPTPNQETCVTDWTCDSDGSVANNGTLSKPAYAICAGGGISQATVSGITFNPGKKKRQYSTTCSDCSQCNDLHDDFADVTYAAGAVYFDPPIPSSFPLCGTYTFQAKVDGTPSDTCTTKLTANSGTVTVVVLGLTLHSTASKVAVLCGEPGTTLTINSTVCPTGGTYSWTTTSQNIQFVGSTSGSSVVVQGVNPSSMKNAETVTLTYQYDGYWYDTCSANFALTVQKPTSTTKTLQGTTLTAKRYETKYLYQILDQFGDAMTEALRSEERRVGKEC